MMADCWMLSAIQRVIPMREWLLGSTPLMLTIYFLLHPASFGALISWTMGAMH
jgi:hypothetical protein